MGLSADDVVRAWLQAHVEARSVSEVCRLMDIDRDRLRFYLLGDKAPKTGQIWVRSLGTLAESLGISPRQMFEELRDQAMLMERGGETGRPPSAQAAPAPSLADQLRLVAEALEAGKLPPASMTSGELRRLGVSAPAPVVAPAAPRPDLDAAAPAPPPRRPRGRPPKLPR